MPLHQSDFGSLKAKFGGVFCRFTSLRQLEGSRKENIAVSLVADIRPFFLFVSVFPVFVCVCFYVDGTSIK